jgi:hypothetical protein
MNNYKKDVDIDSIIWKLIHLNVLVKINLEIVNIYSYHFKQVSRNLS